jgi:hypothetical protein
VASIGRCPASGGVALAGCPLLDGMSHRDDERLRKAERLDQ